MTDDTPMTTGRPTVPAMEKLLGLKCAIPAIPGGFIRVVDYMGDDAAVVQAARVSYGNGTKEVREDRALIRYLLSHRHTTPFEMCEIKLHIKMPIFVARQFLRHRTASVNEHSARYSVVPEEFHLPKTCSLAEQDSHNKQGRTNALPEEAADAIREKMQKHGEDSFSLYTGMLESDGLSRELARIVLPLSTFTEMYWKCDLHNLLRFISLRSAPNAQKEIQTYANTLAYIIQKWLPLVYEAWRDYGKDGAHFSRMELELLGRMLRGENVDQKSSGLSPREWREFNNTFSTGFDK